jgi:orotate phosphoribosyltransferase
MHRVQSLILGRSLPQILEIDPSKLGLLSREEFLYLLTVCGALWRHSGKGSEPHAELTTGLHSDSYVNVPLVLQHEVICSLIGYQLLLRFTPSQQIHWVVGSANSAIPLAKAVAEILGAKHGIPQKSADGAQVWDRGAYDIKRDERVLQVEEQLTTGQTIEAVRNGIRKAYRESPIRRIKFCNIGLVFVHRGSSFLFDKRRAGVLPLIHLEESMRVWDPKKEGCSLCDAGSVAERPKENWTAFVGRQSE